MNCNLVNDLFYLLGIVEVVAIVDVFALGWVEVILQFPEVGLSELRLVLGGESLLNRVVEALLMLVVNCRSGGLREALSVEVLTCNLRNVTCVSGNVLSFNILCWAADPVLASQ